jgi:hypothetical protein
MKEYMNMDLKFRIKRDHNEKNSLIHKYEN